MLRTLLVLVIATLFNHHCLAVDYSQTITCSDMKTNVAGWFINKISSSAPTFYMTFYLSTNRNREPVKIDTDHWIQLKSNEFDVSKKTFLITHGYLSDGKKPWVLDLKDAILDSQNGNVIIVDWSVGSNKKNYVNAAKNTIHASNGIFNFLEKLRDEVQYFNGSSSRIAYNHLHLIGHSLGAHICGQAAHLLKENNYWKVDRITGLDPAKPCFNNVGVNLRIDKENAAFVDIIHTNIGKGLTNALGMTKILGHVDFYLNGGYVQPKCHGKFFAYKEMICSHTLATKYFIESIRDEKTGRCTFPSQRWNGSYLDAQIRIKFLSKGLHCKKCPKMGMNTPKSKLRGAFLVLTGAHQPYCDFEPKSDLRNVMSGLKKLKKFRSIFY